MCVSRNLPPSHQVRHHHWGSQFSFAVDRVHEPEEEQAVLVFEVVDLFGLRVVKVVCEALGYDCRHVVILALLFRRIRTYMNISTGSTYIGYLMDCITNDGNYDNA